MNLRSVALVFLSIALLLSTAGLAQTPNATAMKIDSLDVFGSWRVRMESWDWFHADSADGTYTFAGSLLRLGIRQRRPRFDWQIELAQPTLLGLPSDAVAPAPQGPLGLGATYFLANGSWAASAFLKQGFVGLKVGEGRSIRFGRFEFVDGSETAPHDPTVASLKSERIAHRLIGNFGFSHVGRSFDGVEFATSGSRANFTFMAARATRGVFDVDGMGELDTDIIYGAFTSSTPVKKSAGEWRLFALHYHDGRNVLKSDNRNATARAADSRNIRITTVGAHVLQTFSLGRGKADLLLWGSGQTGTWGILDHRGWAGAVEAGYQPSIGLRPWIRAGYFRGSGDSNPADRQHETFFQNLPTPRIYARFPFYNLMNNEDAFLELKLQPWAKLSLRADARVLRLSDARDLWYQGGGAYEKLSFGYAGRPGGGNRSLANVFDVGAEWRVNPRHKLTFYLAGALGKSVMESIYPDDPNAHFGYMEWNFDF